MPSQITNYQCPACTGPLHFSGESGKLQCEYCGSFFDVSYIEELYADKEEAAQQASAAAEAGAQQQAQEAEDGGWAEYTGTAWGPEADGMKAYSCPSCGAELICDSTTAATSCPYCGNPTVVPGQFAGTLKPDYIIPFRYEKKDAVEALKKHYQGKKLLPKEFTDANHIDEIKGVYVPFWLYDASADVSASFEATRSHSHREGQYQVTTTEHFNVYRAGNMSFENIPADGSSKMPDDYMDSIEPYDYGELKPFSTAYLPGFLADKYDVDARENTSRIQDRVTQSALSSITQTVIGYDSCTLRGNSVRLYQNRVKYAMMPVWLLSTNWNGRNFLFAMNGQTGKMVGNLPVDKKKAWAAFFGVMLPVAAVLTLIQLFFGGVFG